MRSQAQSRDGFTAAMLLLALGALGGCEAEADQRAALIREGIDECVRALDSGSAERPGMVPEGYESRRICTCSWERASKDVDLEQLRAMRRAENPEPALLNATGACLVEEARRAGVLSR